MEPVRKDVVQEHGGVGLGECVVALVELIVSGLLVSIRGQGKKLSPEAVVLAEGVCKQAVFAYKYRLVGEWAYRRHLR